MENFDLVSKALAYISTAKCPPSLTVEDVAREAAISRHSISDSSLRTWGIS